MVAPMAVFQLSKWYLDCVTGCGDASILYTGSAGWRAFRLNYSSEIESAGTLITTRQSLRAADEPAYSGDHLVWQCEALGIAGKWKTRTAELRATVFASDAGSIASDLPTSTGRARRFAAVKS